MQVEDITRVGLSSWRSSQQQRHLSVGDGLLGEIVIDDKGMSSAISEKFTDSASGVGSQELKRSSFGSSGSNDNGVFHGTIVLEDLDNVGDGGSLLADSDVDAEELLFEITGFEVL